MKRLTSLEVCIRACLLILVMALPAGCADNEIRECVADSECDDGDVCTHDDCALDTSCVHEPVICDSGATCVSENDLGCPWCGDGVVTIEAGEACDDAGESSTCNDDCTLAVCGDDKLNQTAGEVCDDGNTADGDGCSADCRSDETCGNGVGDEGEVCDDGNNMSGDGCSADCLSDETCGNGIIDPAVGEACDDDNTSDGDGCQGNCALPTCGDGVLDADEVCDDENNVDGDGCSATCMSDETCGNLVVDTQVGEACDPGSETGYCDDDCSIPICGDGNLNATAGEMCDDGNSAPGDGCDALCSFEPLLADLAITSPRVPDLGFTPAELFYYAEVSLWQESISVVATAAYPGVQIEVDGVAVTSGQPSDL